MYANKPQIFQSPTFLLVTILMLAFTVTGFSQTFPKTENPPLFPKKDLLFSQVFAGPSGGNVYAASIAVTNRGARTYNGGLVFFTGDAVPSSWNPVVNGVPVPVTGDMVDIVILPDETRVFYITDSVFTVGYAVFISSDWSLDNHIEGNLTYFSYSGSTLMDVVGVPESQNFQISSLPFDFFPDVGLSLAHDPRNPNPANVRVFLFDEDGNIVATCEFQILPGGHYSKYLWQLPWSGGGVPPGFGPIGKVEIESDEVIGGIAMLVTPGVGAGFQISTLPLGGTPLTYDVQFTGIGDILGDVYTGELTLWIDGYFVRGYLILTSITTSPETVATSAEVMTEPEISPYNRMPILVSGQLIGTELDLSFFTGPNGAAWPNVEWFGVSLYMYVWDFTPSTDQLEGYWAAHHYWDTGMPVHEGNLTLNNTLIPD